MVGRLLNFITRGSAMKYKFYVGIDWATRAHEVCIINDHCEVIERKEVVHSNNGLADMVDWLVKICSGKLEDLAIAIEVPRGAIVECLLERGFTVYSVNPKQLDRFRDRHTVA